MCSRFPGSQGVLDRQNNYLSRLPSFYHTLITDSEINVTLITVVQWSLRIPVNPDNTCV